MQQFTWPIQNLRSGFEVNPSMLFMTTACPAAACVAHCAHLQPRPSWQTHPQLPQHQMQQQQPTCRLSQQQQQQQQRVAFT
jgi:hypothetical protein